MKKYRRQLVSGARLINIRVLYREGDTLHNFYNLKPRLEQVF